MAGPAARRWACLLPVLLFVAPAAGYAQNRKPAPSAVAVIRDCAVMPRVD